MVGHHAAGAVDLWIVERGLVHSVLEVVGHDEPGQAVKEAEQPDMRADPVGQRLGRGRLTVSQARRAQHCPLISRVDDVSINTVSKLLVDAGTACAAFHDETVRDLGSVWPPDAARPPLQSRRPRAHADRLTGLKARQSSSQARPVNRTGSRLATRSDSTRQGTALADIILICVDSAHSEERVEPWPNAGRKYQTSRHILIWL